MAEGAGRLLKRPPAARDPRYVAGLLRGLRPLLRFYYRAECAGFSGLGAGPHLLVANHNAGAAIEPFVLLEEWERRGYPPAYGLTHRFIFRIPGLGALFRKFGSVPATRADAERILRAGASALVFPGGEHEALRPYSERFACDFAGRRGWAELAIAERVPVVPIAISGSHGTNVVFFRARWLARLLVAPAALGIAVFPVALSQLLLVGAFLAIAAGSLPLPATIAGAYLLFLAGPLLAILPARIRAEALTPIPAGEFADADALHAAVTARISDRLRAYSRKPPIQSR